MPVMLFKLRNVPDDEAVEIRELLSSYNIEYYETPAGRWRISMEAIWIKDDTQYDNAKRLLDEYQQQRSDRARQEYRELKDQGQVETFVHRFLRRPIQTFFSFLVILLILYFVTMPFIKIAAD